jgi:riboflavin-specific deaminase-like protein
MRASRRPTASGTHRLSDTAWGALLAAAEMLRSGQAPSQPTAFGVGGRGVLFPVGAGDQDAILAFTPGTGWAPVKGLPADGRDLLDLYLPLCGVGPGEGLVVGHLGQSLNGCIATQSGDSCWVTGPENIRHLHRMRALCDAVLVGAETIVRDDPRLTTRLVAGESPVRVVLDPHRRVQADRRVCGDGAARTLIVCAADQAAGGRVGQAEVAGVPERDGRLDLAAVLALLRSRGLGRVFIEGGGVTVSAFLRAGLLDRLQVTVAPLLIGGGRPGVDLPPAASMGDCLRPRCRVFRMGSDLLFDCEPRTASDSGDESSGLARVL